MNINLIFDEKDSLLPAGFKSAMQFAASQLDKLILDKITVTINVGYGEYTAYTPDGARTQSLSGTVSQGGIGAGPLMSYDEVRSALLNHAVTSAEKAMVAALPATDPIGGAQYLVTDAELLAWGLPIGTAPVSDGSVGFGSGGAYDYATDGSRPPNSKLDFVGVAEHELTHALGRLSGLQGAGSGIYSPLDLYRYKSDGVRETTAGSSAYFSVDGGKTDLSQFATSGDDGDWSGTASGTDAFNAVGFTGRVNTISAADTVELQALGFHVACFAADTGLAAERGRVPVQALRVGERVRLADGGMAPVVWLGHRRIDCARHPRPQDVWPVRVQADAFAPGQPARDLYLSPDHAVFVRGALMPVRYLVNGATIAPVARRVVEYWHVELPAHGVLLAEGLPAESYLDTGNRAAFGEAPLTDLHPDFARRIWRARGCAPLVLRGPRLTAARRRLLARAGELGHALTGAAGVTAWADGQPVAVRQDGARQDGARHSVALPQGARMLRLRSRAHVPAQIDPAGSDTRVLGLAVGALWRDGLAVALDSPALTEGWHAAEPHWRWTDGDAALDVSGCREIAWEMLPWGRYWLTADGGSGRTAVTLR